MTHMTDVHRQKEGGRNHANDANLVNGGNHASRLSSSQQSYRNDPQGFTERLQERADTLFENGYLVYPTDEIHCFAVVHEVANHSAREEKEYRQYLVRYLLFTCTCPFYERQVQGEYLTADQSIVACKHLLGLSGLMRKTRRWLSDTGQVPAYCALWSHWLKTLSAIRLMRVRRQEMETHSGRHFCQVSRDPAMTPSTTQSIETQSIETQSTTQRKEGFSYGNPQNAW